MFTRPYVVGPFLCLVTLVLGQPALPQTACQELVKVSAKIEEMLPAFRVVDHEAGSGRECSQFAAADFNGDGRPDYALVLTEKIAPRHYANGSDWFSAYIVVLLSSKFPYADYQAVFLLGHTSRPDRYRLEVAKQPGRTMLKINNAKYSETSYEWRSQGFFVKQHLAD